MAEPEISPCSEIDLTTAGKPAVTASGPSNPSPIRRSAYFLLRAAGTACATVVVLLGGLIAMAGQPYAPLLVGILTVGLGLVLAQRLFRRFGMGLGAATASATVLVIASQAMASTPPILDATGRAIPGSIAVLRSVKLGGVDQTIVIRGRSEKSPILLFLNGGPGGTQLAWHRQYMGALEDHFLVVYWEQRGSGKSGGLALADYAGLTPQRYTADGLELVAYLRERFRQDKVYLVGQSWGSMLGVWMAQQRPEWLAAYVGIGQMTNPVEDDRLIYDYVLDRARTEGDTAFVRTLQANGRPPYDGFLETLKYAPLFGRAKAYETQLVEQSGGPELEPNVGMTESSEYGFADTVAAFAGGALTFARVYDQLDGVDLESQAPRLSVPVFLAEGRYDLNAMPVLAQRWFDKLEAPSKQLVWFEHSGHNPEHEEPAAFVGFMVNTVLAKSAA